MVTQQFVAASGPLPFLLLDFLFLPVGVSGEKSADRFGVGCSTWGEGRLILGLRGGIGFELLAGGC